MYGNGHGECREMMSKITGSHFGERSMENEKKKEERYYNVDKKPQFMDFDSTAN